MVSRAWIHCHNIRYQLANLINHLSNLGDAMILVIHPATTTHRQLSDDELAAAGIGPGTVRLSIGIEDADDLIWDLTQALDALDA